ncbi:unnamed protein product, partial [Timema podura]|nr:unnamed protein product [Timema podura]
MELTCAYSGHGRSAQWVHLDLPLKDSQLYPGEVEYSVVDDGKMSRLTATSYISRATLEGFYSCRLLRRKDSSLPRLLVTFGLTLVDKDAGVWREVV